MSEKRRLSDLEQEWSVKRDTELRRSVIKVLWCRHLDTCGGGGDDDCGYDDDGDDDDDDAMVSRSFLRLSTNLPFNPHTSSPSPSPFSTHLVLERLSEKLEESLSRHHHLSWQEGWVGGGCAVVGGCVMVVEVCL